MIGDPFPVGRRLGRRVHQDILQEKRADHRTKTVAPRSRQSGWSQPGQPCWSRAATNIAASANGRAKIVWENFPNSPQLRSRRNMARLLYPSQGRAQRVESTTPRGFPDPFRGIPPSHFHHHIPRRRHRLAGNGQAISTARCPNRSSRISRPLRHCLGVGAGVPRSLMTGTRMRANYWSRPGRPPSTFARLCRLAWGDASECRP